MLNKKFEIATAIVIFITFMVMYLVTCGVHDYNLYMMFQNYEMATIAKNITYGLTALSFGLSSISYVMINKCWK